MSLVGRSRSPVSDQRLPSWQRDLILKKRALNRMFPGLYPQAVEISSNGDSTVGAFHPEPTSPVSLHAPPVRNNRLSLESDGARERNRNDVRQPYGSPKQPDKLSEPPATQAAQQPPAKQSRFGAGSAYLTFNGKDRDSVLIVSNNNSFGDDLGRMVSNGAVAENGGDEVCRAEESDEDDREFEYGPGIVNRLRSKFNSLTMRESEAGGQAPLSPVRRVASLEHLLDMDEEVACTPLYRSRSPATRRSGTPPARSSVELLKRARSMETLNAGDRSPGVVVSAGSVFGSRTTFRPFSREDGYGTLSPINDKVIIIEQAKPSPPRVNGAGLEASSGLRAPRVGQDLAWKPASKAVLIDEELPKPDTVRKNKQIFEAELQATPAAESKTIVIRTRKLTPPPKPVGPKPALRARPPPSPTLASPAPKKVFAYLQEKENAERSELPAEATPPREVSPSPALLLDVVPSPVPPKAPSPVLGPPKAPSPVLGPPKAPSPVLAPPKAPSPIPATVPAEQPAIVGETWKSSANFSQQSQQVSLPRDAVLHNGFDAVAAFHPKPEAAASPVRPEVTASSIRPDVVASSVRQDVAASSIRPELPATSIRPEAAAAPIRPVGAIKPFVQNAVAEPRAGDAAKALPPATTGKLVSPGGPSTIYNFVGKDVKPNIVNTQPPFGALSRPGDEVADEEDFCMDGLLSKSVNVDFVGDNVIVGRSALMKTRNKKLKLVFDDEALSTYEYPSESSLLDGETEGTKVSHAGEEHSSSQNAIKVRASIEMGPSVLKSTPAIGSSLGGLSSYTPMVVGSTEAFELGVSRAPPPPPAPSKPEPEKDESDESLFLKPASDDDNVPWSNAATSDILF